MKKSLFSLLIALLACFGMAMAQNPVKWQAKYEMKSATDGVVILTGIVADGWHVYGTSMPEDGPSPTKLYYSIKGAEFTGNAKVAPKPKKEIDDMFGIELTYWEGVVMFTRPFKLTEPVATITVKVNYMACNDSSCRPPQTDEFQLEIKK